MEQQPAAVIAPTFRARASLALRQRHNWEQLAKFCVVGASGYAVNLAVYALLLNWANLHYSLAATGSFLVAVSNNYLWNRVWTFRHQRGHVAYQGLRFLIVSMVVYGANLVLLTVLVEAGVGKIVAQAIAVVLVTPLNFLGNKLWSFRRRG
jgi:putative flippase GtrA